MKIIVDTNIVFSGILNSSSRIGKYLISSNDHFEFFSCDFLKKELLNHRGKLVKTTKLTFLELDELEQLVTANITFINESLLHYENFIQAQELLADIDENDIPFLALTLNLNGILWTGDKVLIQGLKRKGFTRVFDTDELSKMLDDFGNV